jgi:hypothetical protein
VEALYRPVALNTQRSCTGRPLQTWGDHCLIITLVIRDQSTSAKHITTVIVNAVNTARCVSEDEPTCHYVLVEFNFASGNPRKDMRECGKDLWKALQPALKYVRMFNS